MKRSIHKKVTKEDKFARKYYCSNSRLAQLRSEKHQQHKQFRQTEYYDDTELWEEEEAYRFAHREELEE